MSGGAGGSEDGLLGPRTKCPIRRGDGCRRGREVTRRAARRRTYETEWPETQGRQSACCGGSRRGVSQGEEWAATSAPAHTGDRDGVGTRAPGRASERVACHTRQGPRGGRAREWRAIRGKGSQKMTSAASPCLGRRRRKRSVHLLPEPHSVSHPRPAPGVTRPRGRIPGRPRGGPASLSPLTSSPTDAVARRRPSQEPRGVRRAVLGTNARPQPWATAARGNLGSLVSAMLSGG